MMFLSLLAAVGCSADPAASDGAVAASESPAWVQKVLPEPGAIATVPNAGEVDHAITSADEDVRLLIDGVDVTTYATFDAGKIRYEPSEGPIDLGSGTHTAEIQRVTLPAQGADFTVLDSFTWEFPVA